MTEAINYDKHVKNLIDELSKTGHVTHSKHKKTSVTFHHNGGVNVSHEGILSLWRTRPASAAFDIDQHGDAAQYVLADEYAWAVGNTVGNETTISIELTNSSGAPHWEVSETTWKAGARLAGWLFVHEIKAKPDRHNIFPHQHWAATGCPGPFIMGIFDKLVKEVQFWYDHFEKNPSHTPDRAPAHHPAHAPAHESNPDAGKIKKIQEAVGVTADGHWGPKTDDAVLAFRKKHVKN